MGRLPAVPRSAALPALHWPGPPFTPPLDRLSLSFLHDTPNSCLFLKASLTRGGSGLCPPCTPGMAAPLQRMGRPHLPGPRLRWTAWLFEESPACLRWRPGKQGVGDWGVAGFPWILSAARAWTEEVAWWQGLSGRGLSRPTISLTAEPQTCGQVSWHLPWLCDSQAA